MEETLRPGERAPHSGIYRVVHHAHRLPHEVAVEQGAELPKCARCGANVRFTYVQAATFVGDDYDFRPPQKKAVNGG